MLVQIAMWIGRIVDARSSSHKIGLILVADYEFTGIDWTLGWLRPPSYESFHGGLRNAVAEAEGLPVIILRADRILFLDDLQALRSGRTTHTLILTADILI